ncbi:MAG: hypothetical protein ACK452_07820 [Bacteroidota bacterium]|jgi:tetratricopeptide (TPR) repeat protein
MGKIHFFAIFLLLTLTISAQKEKIDHLIEDGEYYMNEREYEKAYSCYDRLIRLDPEYQLHYKIQKAIAATYIPSRKDEAISILEEVKDKDSLHESLFMHLGEAYHHNYYFDQAIYYLKHYIELFPKADDIATAKMFLLQAENGKKITQTMVIADIKNIGSPINTEDAEYVPVISADESMLIFTYRGKKSKGGLMDHKFKPDEEGDYYEDIFYSLKSGDKWSEPASISENINTIRNDAAIALSTNKEFLFTFSSTKSDGGDIYVCKLVGDQWTQPEKLGPTINTKYWEGSCSFSSDGRHLYFASERPGGFGGKDIYVSEMDNNGKWGKAINLGPTINSEYDDDSPFIHPDGKTLFFSSKGHSSIGGYDIMFSTLKENDWTEPVNMGYPLNTVDDDIYYMLNTKGDKGYFSSTRTGLNEKGSHDIYEVSPGIIGERTIVVLLKGVIYCNDVPNQAEIKITKLSTNETIGPFKSNKKNGQYIVTMVPKEKYRFTINAEGYKPYEEEFEIPQIEKYMQLRKDFHLHLENFEDHHMDTIPTLTDMLLHKDKDTVNIVYFELEKNNKSKIDTTNETNVNNGNVTDTESMKIGQLEKNKHELSSKNQKDEDIGLIEKRKKAEKDSLYNAFRVKQNINPTEEMVMNTQRIEQIKDSLYISYYSQKKNKNEEIKDGEIIVNKEDIQKAKSKENTQISEDPCSKFKTLDFASLKRKSLNDPNVYKKLLEIGKNICANGMVFKVQIAAYRNPENYKWIHLQEFGTPESLKLDDGITRFTQGNFNSILDAESQRKKAITKGQRDAWITATYNGKRYTLEELIMVDFFNKNVTRYEKHYKELEEILSHSTIK